MIYYLIVRYLSYNCLVILVFIYFNVNQINNINKYILVRLKKFVIINKPQSHSSYNF